MFNTGNPPGSEDPRDLFDNSVALDNFVNGSQDSYPDRLGKQRNSLAFLQALFSQPVAWLKDYSGYVGNGVADDSDAIQAALNSGKKVILGSGTPRVTKPLSWPMGVVLNGALSPGFELIFDMPAGSDGIIVTEPTSGFNYVTGIRDTLVTSKSRGRYMFTSPKSSNVWNRQCYFDFTGLRVRDFDKSKTILTNYWDRILNLGDTKGVTLERFQMFGGLPADAPSAEAAPCRALYVSSVSGAIGINVRNGSFTSLSFPIEFSDGVEGYTLTDFEIVNCWVGIDHTNAAGEPGGFIDNVHINTNYRGVRFLNRVEFTVGGISVYRSPSFADHSNGWAAVEMKACNFKGVIESVNVVPNNSTVGTNCAIKAVNCAANAIQIGRMNVSTKLSRVLDFDSVSGIHVGHVYARGVDNMLVIANTSFNSSNLHVDDVDSTLSDAALTVAATGTALSTVTVRRTPRGATNQPTSLSITASGDYLIYPKSALNGVSISGSAITANLILSKDGATGGDTVRIKFINGSTTGNKLNICNGANTAVLNVINSGNTNRYIAEYTFSGTNWACNFIHLDLDATLRT